MAKEPKPRIVSAILVGSQLFVEFDNGENAFYPAFFLHAALPLVQILNEEADGYPE